MITELILSSLTSASIAFNANADRSKIVENTVSVNESLSKINGLTHSEYVENKSIDSLLSVENLNSSYSYVDNETNTWKNTHVEKKRTDLLFMVKIIMNPKERKMWVRL
ncbi:MAG: hypothetical protein J6T15_07240 [Bacilli bacterium]|nr:hypothetical protein [Bacilli bacterium]